VATQRKIALFMITSFSWSVAMGGGAAQPLNNRWITDCKEFAKIVGMSTLGAIAYGIVQDQITARISPEYFTDPYDWRIAHHYRGCRWVEDLTRGWINLTPESSPTLIGLVWGPLATWWVGVILGVGLAVASRVGPGPKLSAKDQLKPMLGLLGVTGGATTLAGLYSFFTHDQADPKERRFLTNGYAHGAAYLAGGIGGLGLIAATVARRIWLARQQHMNPLANIVVPVPADTK
jgi:hypothetical protein